MSGRLTAQILENNINFESGKINYLPFLNLGKFTEWFPGVMRGDVTCITGSPASSKTSLSKFLFEHSGIPWAHKSNKNFKILRFGLEESRSQYEFSMLSYECWIRHQLQYNIKDFLSIGRTISKADINLIGQAEAIVEKKLNYVEYIDNIYNSIGIWKYVRSFAFGRGTFYNGSVIITKEEDLTHGWTHYKPTDPDEFIVVVVDNLSYITKSKDEDSRHQAIWNTVEYLRKYAANKLNYSIVFLQHQDSTQENQESRKEKTILPTEAGLAVNKEVRFAYLNLIGIANPNKVNTSGVDPVVRMWDGYPINIFGNYLRTINILKSRFGEANVHSSCLFTGRTGWFSEIAQPKTKDYDQMIYNIQNFYK